MAYSLTMKKQNGYPTDTTMRVLVSFTVDAAGSYYTYFEVYNDETGKLVNTLKGVTYTLDAGGSQNNLPKTIENLTPNTLYHVTASLWNASTGTRLSIDEPSVSFVTEAAGSGGGSGQRPEDWSWTSTVRGGTAVPVKEVSDGVFEAYYLTAEEWNGFVDRVQAFADYLGKDVSNLNAAYVTAGEPMTYVEPELMRQVVSALNPDIKPPSAISSGDEITANFIRRLAVVLNGIE